MLCEIKSFVHLHFPKPFSSFCSWKLIKTSQDTKKCLVLSLKEDCQQRINTVIITSEMMFNWLWFLFPWSWQSENKHLSLSHLCRYKTVWRCLKNAVRPAKWHVRMLRVFRSLKPPKLRQTWQSFCLPDEANWDKSICCYRVILLNVQSTWIHAADTPCSLSASLEQQWNVSKYHIELKKSLFAPWTAE